MRIRNLILFSFVIMVLLCLICCSKSNLNAQEAREILQKFYSDKDLAESQTDLYLLNAGKPIVPYLVKEIENRKMPRRQYAIVALGKINDPRALPVLEKIINDKTEEAFTRGNALTSIWHIDQKLGEEYAKKFGGDKGYIDNTIKLLKKGSI